jgi:hypothetical protein
MKIASKYQVFRELVEIMDKDEERLRIHLKGWNRLNEILLLGVNEPDLRRLVVLELMGQRRPVIIDRLLGRLVKLERKTINDRIARLYV